MKKRILAILIIFVLLLATNLSAEQVKNTYREVENTPRKSLASDEKPFNTAKITYNYMRNRAYGKNISVKGEITVYIDYVNNKRRDEDVQLSKNGNVQREEKMIGIFDGNQGYLIDPVKKTGTIFVEVADTAILTIKPSALDKMDFVGDEKILGKICLVYVKGPAKRWMWQGFLLKEEIKSENFHTLKEAKKIEENIEIDNSLFNVPSDIKLIPYDFDTFFEGL